MTRSADRPEVVIGGRRIAATTLGHALVAVVGFVAAVALADLDRFYGWDEAVYASQFSSSSEPTIWGPQRAPGTAYLVAPVTLLTDSIVAVRLWVAATGSIALAFAFATWTRTIGAASVVAHALFASTAVVVIYLAEVYPNLWLAIGTVALVGLVVDRAVVPDRLSVVLAVVVAAVTLLRPFEAIAVTGLVGILLIAQTRRDAIRPSVIVSAGYAVGVAPWLLRSFADYDGPFDRISQMREQVGTEGGFRLVDTVYLLDDPFGDPGLNRDLDLWTATWFGLVTVLAVVAVASRLRRPTSPVVAAVGASLALAVPFVLFKEHPAPRFFLPVFVLLCVAAGAAIVSATGTTWRRAGAVAVVGALAVAHQGVAHDTRQFDALGRERLGAIGATVDEVAAGDACLVLSRFGGPQIGFVSGCRFAGPGTEPIEALAQGLHVSALDAGERVFIVVRTTDDVPDGWTATTAPIPGEVPWVVAEHP